VFDKINAMGDAIGDSAKLTVVYGSQIVSEAECDSDE
jgi:hypothetical protein